MSLLKRCRTAWSRYHKTCGFGIHSPFAYRFITTVVHERLPYYAYGRLAALRRDIRASLRADGVTGADVLPLKKARLIFRVALSARCRAALQIGSSYGLLAASVMETSSSCHTWLYEPQPTRTLLATLARYPGRVHQCHSAAQAIADYTAAIAGQDPLVIVGPHVSDSDYNQVLVHLYSIIDAGTGTIIFRTAAASSATARLLGDCKHYATHGMTFSNDQIAILIASHKLPRQDFALWL